MLIADGIESVLSFGLKQFEKRAITEPPTSTVIKGPREGFVELLPVNISLLRRRLKTPDLIIENMEVGKFSKTPIAICYINGVADKKLVNKLKEKLNVIFVPDYDVETAEILIPASDISEQISLAGQEASGTGNMKFMANGAITLGTYDGANVEICDLVGEENIYIFGINCNEAKSLAKGYNPRCYICDEKIKKVLDRLDKGFNGKSFNNIRMYLEKNDRFMCLPDFNNFIEVYYKLYELYKNEKEWYKTCVVNISQSYYFSCKRSLKEYDEKIWKCLHK